MTCMPCLASSALAVGPLCWPGAALAQTGAVAEQAEARVVDAGAAPRSILRSDRSLGATEAARIE
jgi:hypothetical protein